MPSADEDCSRCCFTGEDNPDKEPMCYLPENGGYFCTRAESRVYYCKKCRFYGGEQIERPANAPSCYKPAYAHHIVFCEGTNPILGNDCGTCVW